jgi:hypothetical protein
MIETMLCYGALVLVLPCLRLVRSLLARLARLEDMKRVQDAEAAVAKRRFASFESRLIELERGSIFLRPD